MGFDFIVLFDMVTDWEVIAALILKSVELQHYTKALFAGPSPHLAGGILKMQHYFFG